MPFLKRKSRRSPIQRLSDQRRSLALAGLATGAVFSAGIIRRKRRGEEVRLAPPVGPEGPATALQPEPEAPIAPTHSGLPPAVDVPPPASEPQPAASPRPINAPVAAAAPSPVGLAASPIEPATGELSAEEASILSVLAQSGRADEDRTAVAVATALEREAGDVAEVLRKLGAEGVVSGELRAPRGEEIWAVTERGVRRLGAQS